MNQCKLSLKKMMIEYFSTWFVLYLLLLASGYAQESKIQFERVPIGQGYSLIHTIFQDSRGFIWIGSGEGFFQYDGTRMRKYIPHATDENSISHRSIHAIYEDQEKKLWVGTEDGLNRYDWKLDRFIRFTHDPDNPHSIKGNYINCITEDTSGALWVGTDEGLNRMEKKSGHFTHYCHNPDNNTSLSNNVVLSIYEDHEGILWIGTADGLNRWNPITKQFSRYYHNQRDPNSLSHNTIRSIYEDSQHNLWMGTDNGLNQLTSQNKKSDSPHFIHYKNEPENPRSLSSNRVQCIRGDHQKRLWIGTYAGGINVFNPDTKSFARYQSAINKPFHLNNDFINCIYEDQTNMIWIGTQDGVYKYNPGKLRFPYFRVNPYDPNQSMFINVHALYEDDFGNLWVGGMELGLVQLNHKNKSSIHFKHDETNPNSLSDNFVRTICGDSKGRIWIGTQTGGMDLLTFTQTDNGIYPGFKHFRHDPDSENSISHDRINIIQCDSMGILWIGTRNGLDQYDYSNNSFTHYRHHPNDINSLSENFVYSLCFEKQNILWIGTVGGGLDRLNIATGEFQHYKHDPSDPESLSNNEPLTVYKDKSGIIWIGTFGGGLDRFNPVTQTFIHFTEENGLPSNVIYGILEDKNGCLWLSTSMGVSKFNPQKKIFRNYGTDDGLQSDDFNGNAYYKSKSGKMFFGGKYGYNSFYVNQIKDNTHIPPVVINDFRLVNTPVPIGSMEDGRQILGKAMFITKKIKLSYTDHIFSFGFAALEYAAPEKNQYAYRMENVNDKWINLGTDNTVSFHSLPPGEYTLQVKASNNDGVWNEEGTSLHIIITPPFWKTWWFRIFLLAMIMGIIFFVYKLRIRNIKEQKRKLEATVQKRTKELREKNEQILSSIRYGERIQNAILPLTEKIRFALPEHFILYKPRDIVSGDFYWFNNIEKKTVLAVVDCTGHGVPGAFMSMLGNAFLNEIITVQRILDPALILKHLHEEVRIALKQKQEKTETQDGMDVCICVLEENTHKHKLVFAGAKRPLYIIKKEETEFIEIKGDRKSIGGRQREEKRVFTGHEFEVNKGDRLYLTTDGYADQQNPGNKRYGSGQFKNFLQSVSDLAMQEQAKALYQELARHQGQEEQRDDITVVGVRV